MDKFNGIIGYSDTVEKSPGVWKPQVTEYSCTGNILRNSRRLQSADQVNDNITISQEVSVLADAYAYANFQSMLYLELRGVKWKVLRAEPQHPRLILTLGGIYNGQ